MEIINAIGRRKSAVARVYLREGKGNITINDRAFAEYFTTEQLRYIVQQPLNLSNVIEKYDVQANLEGGGFKGQAEAMRLAIARALVKITPEEKSMHRQGGFLTRDPRETERKKPGRKKARKRFQFSKR